MTEIQEGSKVAREEELDWSRGAFVDALQVDARHLDIILNNGSTNTATKLARAREWVGSHRAALNAAALSSEDATITWLILGENPPDLANHISRPTLARKAQEKLARLAGTAESAWRLVSAYTAWENDHNDGEFALWREPDVVNAIIELRAALSSEAATRPTPEPQSSEGGGNRGHLSSAKAAAAPDPEKRDATRPTGDKE